MKYTANGNLYLFYFIEKEYAQFLVKAVKGNNLLKGRSFL